MKLRGALLAIPFVMTATSAFAAPVATVNGVSIQNSEVQAIMAMNPSLAKIPHAHKDIVQNLINMELLYQYAERQGLQHSGTVKTRLALANRQILANAAVDQYVRQHPIPETDIRAAYEKMIQTMGKEKYKVRQILVKTKGKADEILTQLKNGHRFSALARKNSIDKANAIHGGQLGWIIPSMFVPSLARAIETAPIGKPVGPLKSDFGYRIIEVQAAHALTPPPFKAVQDRIKTQLSEQEAARFVTVLRKKAKIIIHR